MADDWGGARNDRGDNGAIPDPQWSDVWSAWGHQELERYIADIPRLGQLKFDQMKDILQELPPRPAGWDSGSTCTAEAEGAVDRLRWDIEQGLAPPAMSPDELRHWCESRRVPVPAILGPTMTASAPSVVDEAPGGDMNRVAASPEFPPWAPVPPTFASTPQESTRKKAGRPQTAKIRNAQIVELGKEFLEGAAREGRTPSLNEIAEHLRTLPVCADMTHKTVVRRIKGELPLEKAKLMAARQQRRGAP